MCNPLHPKMKIRVYRNKSRGAFSFNPHDVHSICAQNCAGPYGDGETHADDAPERAPEHEGEEDDDGVQVHGLAEDAGLNEVARDRVHHPAATASRLHVTQGRLRARCMCLEVDGQCLDSVHCPAEPLVCLVCGSKGLGVRG